MPSPAEPVLEKEDIKLLTSLFDKQKWRLKVDRIINESDRFRQMSQDFSQYLHDTLLSQDEDTRSLVDLLHGKFLGHPLHPVLTDITIGSWALGFFYDVIGILPGFGEIRRTADKLTILGVFTALPTVVSGLTDYSTIKQDAANYGAVHGLLNGVAFFCYVRSGLARLGKNRSKALFYSFLGMGFLTAGSWLGGELVFRHRVGVNHTNEEIIDEWTSLMALDELEEGEPTRAEISENMVILLFRQGDDIYAINAVCSHAGGPLDEGKVVDKVCIQCPWHQSVFDLRNGDVVHGPATYDQPQYEVRIQKGQIEIRSRGIADKE